MRKKINPVTAYMVCLCVFLFVVNITLGCVLVKQSNAALRQSVHERMLDVSETAAALIDGDVLRSLQAEDEGTDEYQSVYDTLKRFQDNIALEYIYCIRSMGNDVFVLTVDPADDPGEFGSPVVVTDALRSACGGVSAVDEEPYENAWGEFYSAYTPLLNSDGTVTELVAVDFSADWYDAQTHRQVLTVMLGCIISMAFAIFIVIMFGVHFKRRFRRMLTTVGQVSDGIETLVKSVMPNRNTAADVVVDDIVFEPDEVG
jgi:sensor histidine kinase regulating citrate/malate metabolism